MADHGNGGVGACVTCWPNRKSMKQTARGGVPPAGRRCVIVRDSLKVSTFGTMQRW